MKYTEIAGTDLTISSLGLGTWVLGGDMWGGAEEADGVAAVQTALDLGVNLIDTAPIYGYGISEKIVGRAIKGRKRSDIIIATKCGLVGKGREIKNDLSPESIRREIEQSLKNLQTDYIDLYQCHWPDPHTPVELTLKEMMKLKNEGKIRYIGVSNFDLTLLKKAAELAPILTLQSQFSMLERTLEKDILPFCRDKGIGVLSYGPLAGGILTGKYKEPPQLAKADARSFFYKHYRGENFNKVRTFLTHLASLGHPLNELALNWVCQQPGIVGVLTGCRNPEQVKSNVAAASWQLTPQEMTQINDWLKTT